MSQAVEMLDRVTPPGLGGSGGSTASLALHVHPRISDANTRKVKETAERMGYQPRSRSLSALNASQDQASHILRNRGIKGSLLAPQPTTGMQFPLVYEWSSVVTYRYYLKPRPRSTV